MIGIEINKKNTNIVEDCIKKNLILNLTSGNVIRLLPPLILKKNEADYISKVLYQILKEYSNEK